ncbi:MAG TPA: AIPR family protein [Stellaceae bacterium]|nr:AIPR family protein [Stellaceae bacterium]
MEASITSVPGSWLRELYEKHSERLFSANYRGFLGITRRRRINTGIRQSAESKPADFWVFNNGITLLTLGAKPSKDGVELTGISIINGAQTTGSIGSIDRRRYDLSNVKVLCRIIECTDPETIDDIVKFNNTQNEIMTWDQYANDPEQNRIEQEFAELGHVYSRKRGFRSGGNQIGIEEVAQPLLAFHGRYLDAVRGKNLIFDRRPLYSNAFESKKARHILFVYSLARAIDERRIALKTKSTDGTIIAMEEEQLALLRNLRVKAFLIAVTARTLESIIGRKVDPFTVAFTPTAANVRNSSLVDLTARWTPLVEAVLTFVSTRVAAGQFSQKLQEEDFIIEISKQVSALLYASDAARRHTEFSALVAES